MSLISRKIFYHRKNDKLALVDFAVVNTSLGVMIEPLTMNRFNSDGQAYDISDELQMVNEIEICDLNQLMGSPPFSDQGTALHGGVVSPRTGF